MSNLKERIEQSLASRDDAKQTVSVKLDTSLVEWCDREAAALNINRSTFIRSILIDAKTHFELSRATRDDA